MPEDCSDMAMDGDSLGVHYTVFTSLDFYSRDICTEMERNSIPLLIVTVFSL